MPLTAHSTQWRPQRPPGLTSKATEEAQPLGITINVGPDSQVNLRCFLLNFSPLPSISDLSPEQFTSFPKYSSQPRQKKTHSFLLHHSIRHSHHPPTSISIHSTNIHTYKLLNTISCSFACVSPPTSSAMAHALADNVFVGFDVSEIDKPFLLDVLAAPGTPWDEKLAIYDLGLFSGYEDWNLMLESAASIKEQSPARSPLDAQDLLAFVPRVKEAALAAAKLRQGWAATDQSIKKLATLLRVHRSGIVAEPQPAVIKRERIIKREGVSKRGQDDEEDEDEDAQPNNQRVKRRRVAPKPSTSHYFAPSAAEQSTRIQSKQPSSSSSPFVSDAVRAYTPAVIRNGIATPNITPRKQSLEIEAPNDTTGQTPKESTSEAQNAACAARGANDDDAGALKASGPQTARDLRVETPSWPSPPSSPSPMNSSESLSPEDLSRIKSEH
ncbi:hypothetical protein BDP55DRAFT_83750 [Colletotrichum godetiae]|uniref:Uncharacterized protein n=1 Tax=Colletotrichum godetiae TaxID=1209918 RepID=A0AAJ0EXI2_9PEZI|nr:uncharacterized protein BDP55DRAFT_83750 [Colletotrichum godetiae]KAK1687686.1 hypothetical protein BDP55DRAFT_83750 [Colletotrichum godetiae]